MHAVQSFISPGWLQDEKERGLWQKLPKLFNIQEEAEREAEMRAW
jgi:hypothetical protein